MQIISTMILIVPIALVLLIVTLILIVLGIVFWAVMLALFLGLGLIIFWIYMIIDAIKRKYKHENEKIVWILVVVLLGILGALIYYFAVKRKNVKKK
jgi:hypothetical protein